MRPICEFEKLAFDSKIVWSHGHILRFEVVIDGVASSTKQQNVQKIDLDVVAFSKRAHIRYVSGKLARVACARWAVLVVVAFWFEFALACRAFVLRTIECSGRLVRTRATCGACRRRLPWAALVRAAEFAVRAQILRAFVFPVVSTARGTNACAFGMVSFARIAKSALARDVSGLAALGTRFLRAFVFPVVSLAHGTFACASCMMSFARITKSALACDVSGSAALGTRALGACVRVATVALRLACRAEAWTILVSGHMRVRATIIANHALDR